MKHILSTISLLLFTCYCTVSNAQQKNPDKAPQRHVHTNRKNAKLLPLPREKGVWHFVVYGDRTGGPRSGLKILKQAVADTNLLDPDLVMTVGDLINGYNTTDKWMRQMKEFHGIMNKLKMRWYPVAGNHDVYWRGPGRKAGEHDKNFEKHFGPLWYWFPHKDSAFIVLYTDEGDPKTGLKNFHRKSAIQLSKTQLKWLAETLIKTKKYKNVMVFLHHPRWLTYIYKKNNWNEAHKLLAAAGNVRAVFAGHIHRMTYGGKKDGIDYFALATTGGYLSRKEPKAGFLLHFNVVTVRADGLHVSTLPVGAVIDPKTIDGARHKDMNALLKAKTVIVKRALKIPFSAMARDGTYVFEMKNPSARPIEVTITLKSDKTWTLIPDHIHALIKPGKSENLAFRYLLKAAELQSAYSLPRMTIQTDYLAQDVRITLPEKTVTLESKLGLIPPEIKGRGRNRSLILDGRQSCLEVPARLIKMTTAPFTLEGWVRADSFKGRRPFLAKTERSAYGIYLSNGVPRASLHVGGRYVTLNGKSPLTSGQWQHIAAVYDGQEFRLYLNGQKVAAARATGVPTRNDMSLFIGADPNHQGRPVDHLKGQIDEVRLSSVARYSKARFKPKKRFEDDKETLLLLHFDRDLGPYVLDHSSKKAHARRLGNARCIGKDY